MSDDRAYVCNVEGAVSDGSAYLLGTRSQEEDHAAGELSLIGGTVEAETDTDVLQATVRREIREETTLEVADEMAYVESRSFHTRRNAGGERRLSLSVRKRPGGARRTG